MVLTLGHHILSLLAFATIVQLTKTPEVNTPQIIDQVLHQEYKKPEFPDRTAVVAQENADKAALEAAQQAAAVDQPVYTVQAPVYVRTAYNTSGNPYTQCAGYVKSRRPDIPNNWGNAGNWYWSAQSIGWPTGSNPAIGAVGWLRGGNHVVYIEAIYGNGTMLVSEANWNGSSYDTRVANIYDYLFIY